MNRLLALSAFAVLATTVLGGVAQAASPIPTTPTANHQPIKAKVVDSTPAHFTVNLKTLANLGVNEEAKTFAIYTSAKAPASCGDFSTIDLDYQKPDKYTRVFDLSKQPGVLEALNQYQCVVIPNKPKLPPAKS